jgi:polysaccharide export outer membrane protein
VTIFTFAAAILSAGCSIMPVSGPESYDVRAGQVGDPERLPYGLVRLTPAVLDTLARNAPRLSSYFTDRRAPGEIRFGIGDIISVTIFEAAAGGLFIPSEASVRPGNFITLPNQAVDSKGNISVPYAGAMRALGRTAVEVQQSIVDALEDRAIKPQVLVSLVEQRTSLISVLGEVSRPDRFPASAAGEHILDAITRAGGPRGQGFDTWVMLEREGHRATVPFGALVYEPANNVYVHPNDTIYVYREPQTFVAFGAVSSAGGATTGGQGQYNFDAWRLSLAEAVAKAGGLNDVSADPASVFLYRGETRPVAEQLGIDCSKFQGPIIPVIYNANLRDPAGYFLATKFQMRNKDVIYVSNAVSVETSKFLTYLRLIMATADDPIVYATTYYALKAATKGTATATTLVTSPAIVTPTP